MLIAVHHRHHRRLVPGPSSVVAGGAMYPKAGERGKEQGVKGLRAVGRKGIRAGLCVEPFQAAHTLRKRLNEDLNRDPASSRCSSRRRIRSKARML